ncbi:MAG: alginate O-acetyltransferase [Limisphaerales bacterium]
MAENSVSKCWTNVLLIGLFMVLLWLPTLDSIFHFDWTKARSENRGLAVFPKLQPGRQGLEAYLAGLETYFNDHFGCRKCLVQWNNKLRWSLFKARNDTRVLIGKNNWLFYTVGDSVDHYSGQLQFTAEELHDWQVLLEWRRDWLARRGIAYLFIVTPDKHTIYPEELPDWVVKVRPETKLDQFMAYMQEHSTVPVLDVRAVVREGKKKYPTYKKTDSHWNSFGSFIAYQEIMQALDKQRPDLGESLPFTAFTVTNQIGVGGDLARFLGASLVESNDYVLIPNPDLPQFTKKMPPHEHPLDPKFTNNSGARYRMIIFQDSFALGWIQFLGYHFNQVSYYWQYALDPERIEAEKPDIVINEMNERFFNTQNPKKLMAKEALN